jgi:hypothetical protein
MARDKCEKKLPNPSQNEAEAAGSPGLLQAECSGDCPCPLAPAASTRGAGYLWTHSGSHPCPPSF